MDQEPPAEYDESGVDVSLIGWMLSLTPAERLEVLEAFTEFVLTARAYTEQD
jgi:hypothetical protein